MKSNFFFKKKNFKLDKLFPNTKIEDNLLINDIKSLLDAKKTDLSFFDSIKYKSEASKTNAGAC